jgi:hypothetical protein
MVPYLSRIIFDGHRVIELVFALSGHRLHEKLPVQREKSQQTALKKLLGI